MIEFDAATNTQVDKIREAILARADVALMRQAGVHAFLVGEAFMRQPDPGVALRELFANASFAE